MKKYSFNLLNIFKLVFSLFIVLFHTAGRFDYPWENILGWLYKYGGMLGNFFFFMISGFFLNCKYHDLIRDHTITLGNFLFKRLKKIYPIYIVAFAAHSYFMYKCGVEFDFPFYFNSLLLISTGWFSPEAPLLVQTWYLCVANICYIIFFAVTYKSKNNSQYIYGFLIFVGYIFTIKSWDFPLCYNINGEGLICFFLGCILYEFFNYCHKKLTDDNRVRIFIIIIISCIFALKKTGFLVFSETISYEVKFLFIPILILSFADFPFDRHLNKFADICGKMSMYVFIWHYIFFDRFHLYTTTMNNNKAFVLYLLLLLFSYSLCILSFWKRVKHLISRIIGIS